MAPTGGTGSTPAALTEMHYPNGWVEYYAYDSMGRILTVSDTHPSEKPAKTQKRAYEYDSNGNITYEYMRGNGTGQAKNETVYTYDGLNRLVSAHDNYGNSTRTYSYDSLGNLTKETGSGSHNTDYRYNNLNQLVDRSDDGWKTHTAGAYDNRGNLTQETYYKANKTSVAGAYVYDETNRMVSGTNDIGEKSEYSYNGLGALMGQTWTIKKNAYGYHSVTASVITEGEVVIENGNGNKQKKEKKDPDVVAADANLNKTSTVVKQFVVDFSSETFRPLQEHEVNGLDYRYVYSDKARLSVVVQGIENGSASLIDDSGELHAYYHTDYLGTTDYLTSALNSKVISWTSYNEWGEITHNAVLKCGQRELDLVKEYATHDYDAVLSMYYAKARFYDAENKRFVAQDPILNPAEYDIGSYVKDPMMLVQYLYVMDNAVNNIDLLGLCYFDAEGNWTHDPRETRDHVRNSDPRNLTLAIGSSGYAVRALQELLYERGYLSAADLDGMFGPKTKDAVKAFQSFSGLSVDGIVGKNTWNAFFNGSTFDNGNNASGTGNGVTNVSSITSIQLKLKRLGYYTGPIDGYYGYETKKAVRNFQSLYNGLEPTGIVDKRTEDAMDSTIEREEYYKDIVIVEPESPDYFENLSCKELIDFQEHSYYKWEAIKKIGTFAFSLAMSAAALASLIAFVIGAGATTAGAAACVAIITYLPAAVKAYVDVNVWGVIIIGAIITYANYDGFNVIEPSGNAPLDYLYSIYGYPSIKAYDPSVDN